MLKKIIFRYSLRKKYSALYDDLKYHINTLSVDIGERSLCRYSNLDTAANYIYSYFTSLGLKVFEENFTVEGFSLRNIYAEIKGESAKDFIIIGAHYDTVENSAGANDNASGIAALLEIAKLMKGKKPKNTVRFSAFTLEEPPFFATASMGSIKHIEFLRKENKDPALMINLDMLGFGSMFVKQNFPDKDMCGIYPARGNFLSLVSLPSCSHAVDFCSKIYNRYSSKKIVAAALPASVGGVADSDHISFIKNGIPAVMFTDTGFLRNPNYHSPDDSINTINFRFLSENVYTIYKLVKELSFRNLRSIRKKFFRI